MEKVDFSYLIKEKFAVQTMITDEMVNCYVHDEDEFSAKIITITVDILIDSFEDGLSKTYRHPSTWFEGFKEKYFPYWLLKKYPIKYKEVSFAAFYTRYKPLPENEFGKPYYGLYKVV